MKRRLLGAAAVMVVAAGASSAFAQPQPPAALPPRPGVKPPVVKVVDRDGKRELTPDERALRGVVVVERNGTPLGLGGVLGGDGRILTALSPLGAGNDLDARFADGTTVKVKIGHNDRGWDLALLVPQTGRWPDGLVASSKEPVRPDANMHSFSLNRGKIQATPLVLRSHRSLLGGDDRQLEGAIEIGSHINPGDLGTPVIDEDGRVVAVVGRGCAPNDNRPCTPVAFGAPMGAIKNFLRTVPPTAVPPAAWLGIQGIGDASGAAKGVRVLVVHPESPADEAHLKGGDRASSDVIVAVDGVPVTGPEALADAIHGHGIGEKVPLIVFSQGRYKTVTVQLRAAPEARPSAAPPASPAELPEAPPPQRPHR